MSTVEKEVGKIMKDKQKLEGDYARYYRLYNESDDQVQKLESKVKQLEQ
jgi:hypothetical protein